MPLPFDLIAAETAPAGGAATTQVIVMVAALTIGFGALAIVGEMHRRGRRTPLGMLAAFSERVSGLPAWAAIPLAVCAVALPGALFGYMWDASLHIGSGRDEGPFANPSHYFILAGLYGIIAAGYLASVLPRHGETPGRSAIKVAPDTYMPLGGALIAASGLFAFMGFPLDDVWHRFFGQDVTLWGPTHLIMLGGGMLTLIGVALLFEEGVACAPGRPERFKAKDEGKRRTPLARIADLAPDLPVKPIRALIAGGFLAGLSIFQGEFDFGVPQFELVLQPLMIAVSAAIALVAARLWLGAGGALAAVAFYLVIRGIVAVVVGPILGETTPSAPLYIPEAICVELAALVLIRRPLVMGAVAGLAIGTLGFAAEWPWIDAVFRVGWSDALLPEGPLVAAAGGTAAGVLGALFGLCLRRELSRVPRRAGALAAGSLAAVMACFAFGLADRKVDGVEAQVTLTEVAPAPEREVIAEVRFDPPQAVEGASWIRSIAWQGGGLVGDELEEVAPGVYRTPEPLPVHGEWKSAIRVQNGHTLLGVPVFQPEDTAIPASEVSATASFTREMGPDRELLQRERKDDVPGWLWFIASLTVLGLFAGFSLLLAWGLARHSRGAPDKRPPRGSQLAGPASRGAGVA